MATEVKVPALGESIASAIVMEWLVEPGSFVERDQDLVVLETDKITVNVPSPVSGTLVEQRVAPDEEVQIGAVIAVIDETATARAATPPAVSSDEVPAEAPAASSATPATASPAPVAPAEAAVEASAEAGAAAPMMPAARRLVAEHGLDPRKIQGTGRGGRILKADVMRALGASAGAAAAAAASAAPPSAPSPATAQAPAGDRERVVPMSKLRQTIARRLVEAQRTAAILTTFNEVDMSAVKALRASYRDAFEKKHGVRLGFTSFFAKAVVEALKAYPAVNAEIRDDSIVYKDYYHIGVAVGGGRGLVVPVIRDADKLSFGEFEKTLAELAQKARDNKLSLSDLQGGTFTISNGGVYGSLLSTPILNPPQSGILGLHKIEDRPVAVNGQVVVRPMMYIALSYDHRLIDGREAVSFLVRVKECIEDPARLLLEV